MTLNFLSNVPFVAYMSSIMKATSDDDKPIPGYLYGEISKISFESAENCETLVDCLADRLQRDSTHVKLKVLKLMKHLVENGHPNFRLGLLKKSTGIKEATKYSGPPDPLHGNVPYVLVRKTAQSVSEMLFNLDNVSTSILLHEPTVNSVGIGSDSRAERNNFQKMEGFGNTPGLPQSRSLGENIKEGLFNLVERLGETAKDEQRELLYTLEGRSGYIPPSDNVQTAPSINYKTTEDHLVTTSSVSEPLHIPGKAGGGWDDDDDNDDDDCMDKSDTSNTTGNLGRIESNVQQDYSCEQNLVQQMIQLADENMSILLKRNQLKDFVKSCGNLNCDKIVEFLNIHLSSSTDQDVMRSLMLIESLIYTDLVNLDRVTHVCKDTLSDIVKLKTGNIQIKSEKLIRILEKLSGHDNCRLASVTL